MFSILESLITDDDFAAQLDQIKFNDEIVNKMHKQGEDRVCLIDSLKAKRAESVEA